MAFISARQRLRPTRIGFLVDPTDLAGLRQVAQINCCLWGGLYNPVIPVCQAVPSEWGRERPPRDGRSLAMGYINFFEPDTFVEVTPGLSDGLGIPAADMGFRKPRIVPLSAFVDELPEYRNDVPMGTSMVHVYRHLYDKEFKFVPRHDQHIALLRSRPDDAAFVDVACGGFPTFGLLSGLGQAYIEAFEPKLLRATPKNWSDAWSVGSRFPLWFTRQGIERSPDSMGGEPILFVADPSSSLDLMDLWNLRIYRRHVVPINLRWFSRLIPFLRRFIIDHHQPYRDNPQGLMSHTTLQFGRSITEDKARALCETLQNELPPGSWGQKTWYDPIWIEMRDEHAFFPKRAHLSAKSRDLALTLDEGSARKAVSFDPLAPDFAPPYNNSPSAWVNVLSFRQFGEGQSLALAFPADFEPNRTMHWRTGGISLPSREGLAMPQQFRDIGERLSLMSGRDAIQEWLKQHGIEAEPSSSGKVAEQVIQALGGIGGTRLLAHRETVRLLDRMAKSTRKFEDGTHEEYQDRTAAATQWAALVAQRRKDIWFTHLTLDDFVHSNVLRLGLATSCSHCEYSNWYGIGELRESQICDRCRKSYAFPQGSLGFTNSPWKFRAIGPFSVPDYADGAYATALTLRVFSNALASGHAAITYSTGLTLKPSSDFAPFELDFSVWYRRDTWMDDESATVAVFGETKSFGAKCFHDKDVDRMRDLAKRFPGAFVVFAALKDELDEEEKSRIGQLAQWGRELLPDGRPRAPVIVLTGTELFCSWHLTDAWKVLPGLRQQMSEARHIHLDNLWDLADATQQIYLDLPSRSEERRRMMRESATIPLDSERASAPTARKGKGRTK